MGRFAAAEQLHGSQAVELCIRCQQLPFVSLWCCIRRLSSQCVLCELASKPEHEPEGAKLESAMSVARKTAGIFDRSCPRLVQSGVARGVLGPGPTLAAAPRQDLPTLHAALRADVG
eukprot:2884232-Rhodomonas_salina.2